MNGSANNIWLGKRFNQILYSYRNDLTNVRLQERFNQTIYMVDEWFNQTLCSSKLKNNTKETLLIIARQSRHMTYNFNHRASLNAQLT